MSAARFLENLLDGAEVEWRPLKSVLVRTKGTKITAGQMKTLHKEGAPLKIFAGGRTVAFVNYGDIPDKDINRQPSIIVKSRGVIAFEFYDQPFSHKNEMWSYHTEDTQIEIKFVYHFLKLNEPYFQGIGGKMQMPQISTPVTDDFLVPIPCPDDPERSLAIQRKIIKILDTFTELTAELTAELTQRKKQYDYYRDQLLTFDEDEVECRILGEIAAISTGRKPAEILTTPTEYEYINAGTSRSGYIKESNCDGDTVTTPSRGQGGIGFVGFQRNPFWLGPLCYKLQSNDGNYLMNRYLFHFLQSNSGLLLGLKKEGGVPAVNKVDLSKLEIPVPSLAEQARVVAILDKFDTLTTSLTEGLPREIELRNKQYAYYRDQLLSFPKPYAEVT